MEAVVVDSNAPAPRKVLKAKRRKAPLHQATENNVPPIKKSKQEFPDDSSNAKKVRSGEKDEVKSKGISIKKLKQENHDDSPTAKKVRFDTNVKVKNIDVVKKEKKSKSYEKTSKKLQSFKKGAKKVFKNTAAADKKPSLHELNKKGRKEARKTTRNNYELAKKAKQLWEIVRCDKLRKGKCQQLTQELYNLIKGKTKEIIYAHDTCRIIECLMIVGNEQLRTTLFDDLKDEIPKLMMSKYAKFFVLKVLKYGTKAQKDFVISSFYGNVLKYMKHTEAASVVEFAYNECANASQRSALTEEFYGPIYRLFKNHDQQNLSALITADPSKKKSILGFMKENLMQMMTKTVMQHSLVHHVVNEFLNCCSADDKKEIIEALRECVVQILHTKDGSRVAMKCIWHGNVKDRKAIVKTFKTHVAKICKEEHGHLVLLAIFENVDDTVIVQKIILHEIITNLKEIISDPHGRKVILHLLSPRHSTHCHPDVVKILQQGDDNVNSKKDKDVRHKELLEKIAKPLLKFLDENMREMIFNPSSNIVAQSIVKHATGDVTLLFQKISELVAEPFVPGSKESPHMIEDTAAHFFIKHLIKTDKERHEKDQRTLSEHVVNSVPQEQYAKWILCNRGCFVLIWMIETEVESVVDVIEKALHRLEAQLRKSNCKAADILLKKLDQ